VRRYELQSVRQLSAVVGLLPRRFVCSDPLRALTSRQQAGSQFARVSPWVDQLSSPAQKDFISFATLSRTVGANS
jgi:hypothetical protein